MRKVNGDSYCKTPIKKDNKIISGVEMRMSMTALTEHHRIFHNSKKLSST